MKHLKNPQKNKKAKSYIRNELRYDDKNYFSKPLEDYKLHNEYYIKIINIINKHKK